MTASRDEQINTAAARGSPRRKRRGKPRGSAIRILTAVPICDGHDSPIISINIELVRHGIEVIYLGYHRSARDIVRAAIQEDVQAIGLSSYNGGHVHFFNEVLGLLRQNGAGNIGLFGGGGGTITPADAAQMKRRGVDEIFFAGTPFEVMVKFVEEQYGKAKSNSRHGTRISPDLKLARALTAGSNGKKSAARARTKAPGPRIIGITGPGGAGKTTLIDELALRFLEHQPKGRMAILSHDPGATGKGALLGDRATLIYAQHDRVFIRSLSTRGAGGGLSPVSRSCLAILKLAGFDLILVESAGIGQEDMPFRSGLVDKQVLVMSPDYGSRLQLLKILMLDAANVVVVNKADLPGARTALAELGQRLIVNQRGQKLIGTVAKRHRDPGVDQLFQLLL